MDMPHIAPGRTSVPREDPETLARDLPSKPARGWRPRGVLLTRSAHDWAMAARIAERAAAAGAAVEELAGDRVTGLSMGDPREVYRRAKSTLVVAIASEARMRPQPIPPSTDGASTWRRGATPITSIANAPDR